MFIAAAFIVLSSASFQGSVNVRSDHAVVTAGGESYRLVGARQPMTAVVRADASSELVVEVIRLGYSGEPTEGAVPLRVMVEKTRNVFPNRADLQPQQRATWAREVGIASFPVRYPLVLAAGRPSVVRVALLRPDRGGNVGVRLTLQSKKKSTLAELDKSAGGRFTFPALDARPKASKKSNARRKKTRQSRAAKKTPPKLAQADTTPQNDDKVETQEAGNSDRGEDEGAGQGEDSVDNAGEDEAIGGGETGSPLDAGPPPAPDPKDVPKVVAPTPEPARGRLKVVLRNEMGTFFKLQQRTVTIDGVVVHREEGALPYPRTIAFDRAVQSGQHAVEVRLSFLGDGGLFFQYVNGYTFHVNDRRRLDVPEDGRLTVVVSGVEAGGPFAELTDKPSVKWTFER